MPLSELRIAPDRTVTIPVFPGDRVQNLHLLVSGLLAEGETVQNAVPDDTVTVPEATGREQTVLVDLVGPANGVTRAVRLAVTGSAGSLRTIPLLIVGRDPLVQLAAKAPENTYLCWRDNWQAGAVYKPNDLVLYNGLIYLARQGNTGKIPDLYLADWLPWAGTGGGEGGGGPAAYTGALRGVVNGQTYELTLGLDEYGGVTTVITNLTGES